MSLTSTDRRAKLSESAQKRWSRPGEVNAQSIRMQQMWCDPEFRKRHQESLRNGNKDRQHSTKGSVWINNGAERQRIAPSVAIPDGWTRGKEASAAVKPVKMQVRGSIWINDGSINRRVAGDVPDGWLRGRA